MRRNPLSPTPPRPAGVLHRMGDRTALQLRELFGDLGSEFDDIHRGVFLTQYPIVAYSYAADRMVSGENEFGLNDVLDPPALIGFNLKEQEYIDTDAMQVARTLLEVAIKEDFDEVDLEGDPDALDAFSDYARSSYFDPSDEEDGIRQVGGDIGNRPDVLEFALAAKELQEFLRRHEEDVSDIFEMSEESRKKALQLAAKILPQTRVITEIPSKQVACILVIHPMTWNREMGEALVDPTSELEDLSIPEGIDDLNLFILRNAEAVYRAKNVVLSKIDRWHGTSLSIARAAYPELVPPAQYHAGVRAGSTYSQYQWEEFESALEEEEEE